MKRKYKNSWPPVRASYKLWEEKNLLLARDKQKKGNKWKCQKQTCTQNETKFWYLWLRALTVLYDLPTPLPHQHDPLFFWLTGLQSHHPRGCCSNTPGMTLIERIFTCLSHFWKAFSQVIHVALWHNSITFSALFYMLYFSLEHLSLPSVLNGSLINLLFQLCCWWELKLHGPALPTGSTFSRTTYGHCTGECQVSWNSFAATLPGLGISRP